MISIIVMQENGGQGVRETLESLARQQVGGGYDYEILVARGMHAAAALNQSLCQARGEIIAFTASGIILDRRWLDGLIQCFEMQACDAVGGRVLPLYPKKTPSWARHCKYVMAGPQGFHDYGYETAVYDTRLMAPFSRLNCAVRRRSLEAWGCFDETMRGSRGMAGEDRELFKRFEQKGARIVYCGQALAYHPVEPKAMTYGHLARWFMDYGRYCARRSGRPAGIWYCGVPRWKLKALVQHSLQLLLNLFDRRGFFEYWEAVFANLGEIREYRRHRNAQCQRHHTRIQ
jgi:hypothetical protein